MVKRPRGGEEVVSRLQPGMVASTDVSVSRESVFRARRVLHRAQGQSRAAFGGGGEWRRRGRREVTSSERERPDAGPPPRGVHEGGYARGLRLREAARLLSVVHFYSNRHVELNF